jgi:hypothetical protein
VADANEAVSTAGSKVMTPWFNFMMLDSIWCGLHEPV